MEGLKFSRGIVKLVAKEMDVTVQCAWDRIYKGKNTEAIELATKFENERSDKIEKAYTDAIAATKRTVYPIN